MKTIIVYRLKDPMKNKSTLSVLLKRDGTLRYVFYGSWQPEGTRFALSNMQMKESLPVFMNGRSVDELDVTITSAICSGVEHIDHKEKATQNA